MIDIALADIAAERHTSDGRFVLFTKTDLPAGSALPWWGVTFDTGSDGHGILVRLDARTRVGGWTALNLLSVARARSIAEASHGGGMVTGRIASDISTASSIEARRSGQISLSGSVRFASDGRPSPYGWTAARLGGSVLPLCPDPEGIEEGVTLEQLLIVLDQLYTDAAARLPRDRALGLARHPVVAALAAEVRRVTWLRQQGR